MPNPVSQPQPRSAAEWRDSALLVDVLVLSSDLLLFEATRAAIGERNPVWRARSAEEAVDLLLTGRCGVLLVDMAAMSTGPDTLIAQIVEQFPDVVVVVAGRQEDEGLLGRLISDGLVYRFMHKPLTAKRAGMFLHAAIRRHVELRESRATQPFTPLAGVMPRRFDLGKWLFVAAGLALFVALLWFLGGDGSSRVEEAATSAAPHTAAPVATPARQADPVLSRARAAFAAARYEAPAGRNALDLYAAVLLARPDQAEARSGLDDTIDRIVGLARRAETDGNHAEARRLLARVESADALNLAVRDLAAELARPMPKSIAPPPGVPAASPPAMPKAPENTARQAAQATVRSTQTTATTGSRPTEPAPATRAPQGTSALDHRPVATAPPVARPDPLTPRVVNADELRASAALARRAPRNFGAPISNGLPTAGYVKPRRAEPPAPVASASGIDPAAAEALAMPADEFGRVHSTDPVYPPAALRDHVEGWVELLFTITETGAVRDIEVVDSEPRGVFESAASEALGAWRFRPRLANGQPVARRSTFTLRFNVDR